MDLRNQRIVVTGASRGIGEAMARQLSAKGASVALVARSAEALEKIAADIGGQAYPADLAKRKDRDELIPRIERDGPIDVLVNNAGLLDTVSFLSIDPSDIDAIIDVNLHAPIQLARAVLPLMVARGHGKIVDISSMGGSSCTPGVATYSATKAGLSHFSACVRTELRGSGISNLIVELGPVDTEMEAMLHAHGPTHRSMVRLRTLRLIRHLPVERVAAAVVRAVEKDRTYLRMPKRAAAFPIIATVPRQIGRVLLAGVDHSPT